MEFRRVDKKEDIFQILVCYNKEFIRSIAERVGNLQEYAQKLSDNAYVYLLVDDGNEIGMLAYYANDCVGRKAFLTSVAITKAARGNGYGKQALEYMERHCKDMGYKHIALECDISNDMAMGFYEGLGYSNVVEKLEKSVILEKEI